MYSREFVIGQLCGIIATIIPLIQLMTFLQSLNLFYSWSIYVLHPLNCVYANL